MGKTRIEPEPVVAKGKKTMEWTELAQHNTPKSLMVAIRGRVYDVTEFLDRHPGQPI
jgi:cytochrome b involved in lipid metabolism